MPSSPTRTSAPGRTAAGAFTPAAVDALVLGRALGLGGAVVFAAFGVAWWIGVVPPASASFGALGAVAAIVAAIVAVWLHGRFLSGRGAERFAGDGRLLAGHLQGLLAAAFAVKLLVLVVAVFALRQQGVKFDDVATFAVTFAGASLLCQVTTAACLARAVRPKVVNEPVAAAGSDPAGVPGRGPN